LINYALIGCGRIAQRHASHIHNYGKLVAVCDIDENKAKQLSDKYQVPYYTNIDELLATEKTIDVVSVCTPNGLHAEHSIKALRSKLHVLCEKPMAINVHDCNLMIKEAEKANKSLFVVKQNRFNPPVVALKKAIDENKLGKPLSIQLSCFWNRNEAYYQNSWKGNKNLDGGTLFTQFSHFIDLLYWLVGDVEEVFALGGNLKHENIIEFEDTGVVSLKFHNGVLGTINYTVNSHQKNMEGSITIFGEKGTIKVGGQYLNELEYQNIENYKIEGLSKGNPANNYGEYQGSMSNHNYVYKNVVDVLTNEGIIATNGFEGLKTVEIIEKIYTSIKKNATK